MLAFILSVHVLAALAIVVLVLLQHGKGADMGAAFGSGSAGSLFGAAGAANFLSRSTAVCTVVFFSTSLALTYLHSPTRAGIVSGKSVPQSAEPKKDAADAIPAPTTAPAPATTPAVPPAPEKK